MNPPNACPKHAPVWFHTADCTSPIVRLPAHIGLWVALLLGAALKASLLLSNSITFDADEAIVALMARHILQGEHPLFFYGQSYMGALDAYLLAPVFLIFGQTVLAVRLVQIVLYLAVLATTYLLACRLGKNPFAATAAALLVAIPPVLFSLYTTATLGNYVEILLINNLLWLLGWDILAERGQVSLWWLIAGFLVGLGWWAMALVLVSVGPLALLGLWRFRPGAMRRWPWRKFGLLVLGLIVGVTPWLIATVQRGADATLSDLLGTWFVTAPGDKRLGGVGYRLFSMLLFNLPSLFGLRPPWSVEWIALPVGIVVLGSCLSALWWAIRRLHSVDEPDGVRIALASLLGAWLFLLLLFVFSPFGSDPTGRYLLPLYTPLAILFGGWLDSKLSSGRWGRILAPILLLLCLCYNFWGNLRSMLHNPPGLTTQFDPISHIPHDHDDALIAFLDSIGADRGYSNYWVAFRFAFLTGERIIFSPRLPYKADLSYTYGDDRYRPYTQALEAAERVVYVTSNNPSLDAEIRSRFEKLGVAYREKGIGPYTVFYALSQKVTPDDLGPFGVVSERAIHND